MADRPVLGYLRREKRAISAEVMMMPFTVVQRETS
jgi:hypothetical protein